MQFCDELNKQNTNQTKYKPNQIQITIKQITNYIYLNSICKYLMIRQILNQVITEPNTEQIQLKVHMKTCTGVKDFQRFLRLNETEI